jgi:ATP synthase protein I
LATDDSSSTPPSGKDPGNLQQEIGKAADLPYVMIFAMLVGGAMGYVLDHFLHTRPWLMVAFGVLGFGVGVRDVLRRAAKLEIERKNGNDATKP